MPDFSLAGGDGNGATHPGVPTSIRGAGYQLVSKEKSYKYWFLSGRAAKPTFSCHTQATHFSFLAPPATSSLPQLRKAEPVSSVHAKAWKFIQNHPGFRRKPASQYRILPSPKLAACSVQLGNPSKLLHTKGWAFLVFAVWFSFNLPFLGPPALLAGATKGNTSPHEGCAMLARGPSSQHRAIPHPLPLPTHVAPVYGAFLSIFTFTCSCICV